MAKKVTVQELHSKFEQLELSNELQHGHLSARVDDLKEAVRDNREFFTNAIKSLDQKIFWILGLAFTTLITVIGTLIGDMV
jgi:hypothetical protein